MVVALRGVHTSHKCITPLTIYPSCYHPRDRHGNQETLAGVVPCRSSCSTGLLNVCSCSTEAAFIFQSRSDTRSELLLVLGSPDLRALVARRGSTPSRTSRSFICRYRGFLKIACREGVRCAHPECEKQTL
ncbi:hypothetical protein FA13DRAFT_1694520 [Coprinellus micaceus]|uniref:Uncharacterized protein n=1 Tax=Coprinellus micaceus TaxID=71717 RepID=A0A4Y7SNV7_COPMI|nr:hypothetical protein FA13DRAFT_1694520 [Coprinellus micaceus]